MLPFLGKKKVSASIIHKNIDSEEPSHDEEVNQMLSECAQSIIEAIHSRSPEQLAQSLKNVFQLMEMMPHEEEI